jgi:FkbM family methyltransferase
MRRRHLLVFVVTGLLTGCGGKRGDPSTASTAAPPASTTASSTASPVGLTCRPRGPFAPSSGFYSQFYEDYILSHVFEGVRGGVYVDVGANDPDESSVTKFFYLAGWRGINIEPDPNMFALLDKNRPEDINLEVGISDKPGTLAFYRFKNKKGLATFDRKLALRHQAMGAQFEEIPIPMSTLEQALAPYEKVAHGFAFLNVDVEGFERQVFASVDLKEHRPSVILAEATVPLTETASYQAWEPMLFAAGYLFAMDDGLNRYYVHPDHRDLLTRFAEANYCVQADKIAKGIRLNGYLLYGP